MQGFVSKSADLVFVIAQQGFPEIVGFTETFLDKSRSADLQGYIQVARLDRRTGEQGGGIILFAKSCFENTIVHIGGSAAHERSWFIIHSDRGGILLGRDVESS